MNLTDDDGRFKPSYEQMKGKLISSFIAKGAKVNAETQPPSQVLGGIPSRGTPSVLNVLEIGALNQVRDSSQQRSLCRSVVSVEKIVE